MLNEYSSLLSYSESEKQISLPNGSTIQLGYCSSGSDTLRYQGQEYDIIAIDEATQLSEYQFSIFKACLRGVGDFPKRMYLTCNPGGIGHGWVKRLFVDREFREDEDPNDYAFVKALVYDNTPLTKSDPGYIKQLESLPKRLKDAWLHGRWDVFEGQFFPEFSHTRHICERTVIQNKALRQFVSFDYGFDMTAALLIGVDSDKNLFVLDEFCSSGLTLSEAAAKIVELCQKGSPEYAVASPDLWNRRQDSGRSGFEIMQVFPGMPPMMAADNRRIPGWRVLREYLADNNSPSLSICSCCHTLIRSLPALMFDSERSEDASGEPHSITHAPEALRYAVMSRAHPSQPQKQTKPHFKFQKKANAIDEFINF